MFLRGYVHEFLYKTIQMGYIYSHVIVKQWVSVVIDHYHDTRLAAHFGSAL